MPGSLVWNSLGGVISRIGEEVDCAVGLVPIPYDSGNSRKEQGISKADNKRIRVLAVEIAWC